MELEEFTKTGNLPESCDQDMRYCLELQKERQRDRDIIMKYEFVPRGHFAEGGGIRGYFIWAIKKICLLFAEAGKSVSMVASASGSAKWFENQMKKILRNFSMSILQVKSFLC